MYFNCNFIYLYIYKKVLVYDNNTSLEQHKDE